MDHAIRAGLVAYGVVHLLVGWLALQLAFGEKEDSASNSGALHYLAQQPMGGVLVWLIAIGMFLLVAVAAAGVRLRLPRGVRRHQAVAQAGHLAVQGGHLRRDRLERGADRDRLRRSGGGTDSTTAKLMDLPGGQLIVGAVGLAIIGYGGSLVFRGWTEKFREHLDGAGTGGQGRLGLRPAGQGRLHRQGRGDRDRRRAVLLRRDHPRPEEVGRARPGAADGARAAVRPGAADGDRARHRRLRGVLLRARQHLSR